MGYLALGLAVTIGYLWSGIPYRMRFRRTPALHSPYEIEAGPEGMSFTTANGHTQMLWEGYVDFQESQKNFLLYTQRNLFFVLPKRALPAEEISSFRELAKSHITTK